MTDPEALAHEDLVSSGYPAEGGLDVSDPGLEAQYDDGIWDDYLYDDAGDLNGGWSAPAVQQRAPASSPPWFRNPRLLFGLITVAAAALVVASVLLITGRQSGEIPTAPHLSTRSTPTSAAERSGPQPSSEATSVTPTSSSPSAETSSAEAEPTADSAAPEQPAEPPAGPPPAPAAEQPRNPAGPKINVTRTPMSFTPGKH